MGQFILNGRNYSGITYANGCFIDTDNVITSGTYTGTFSYTANCDCIVVIGLVSISSNQGTIKIDDAKYESIYNTSGNALAEDRVIFLKKGQTLSVQSGYSIWTSAYTVYGIQEGSPVTFLSEYASACYDTNEREVGCWVDGKPIYQKTIVLNSSVINDEVHTDVTSLNIDRCVGIFGVYTRKASGGYNFTYAFNTYESNAYCSWARYYDSQKEITHKIYLGSGESTDYQAITIRYTKTTDVAGSGKLTPTAMPTVHYDGNEKVIGTWFGETLYEKVISLTSGIAIGSYGHISLPANSIVRGLDGYAYRNSHASVDRFNGFINSGDLYASIRSGQIEYWISNIFSPVEEITFTIQYTKTT